MKNSLKTILFGSLALLAIVTTTIQASEQELVASTIRSLSEQFKKTGAQEEAKWLTSLSEDASDLATLQNYIKDRISTVSRAGSRANKSQRVLSSKSEKDLVNDYLVEQSLGEAQTTPAGILESMSQQQYQKLAADLIKLNKQAIKNNRELVAKNAKIISKYREALRESPK